MGQSLIYPPELELIVERLERLRDDRASKGRSLTYDAIGQSIGVSAATVSNFINHKDPENSKLRELAQTLKVYIDREVLKDSAGMMKLPFAETRQAGTLVRAYQYALQFNRLVVVIGHSGFGKSRTIEELRARDASLIKVVAWGQMGASGLLKELCGAVKESERGLQTALMKRLRYRLKDSGRVVIIDDAHTLKFAALDTLRYLYDQTGVGMMLVGIPSLKRHLIATNDETEQLASRVSGGRIFEMPDLNEHDVRKILDVAMPAREAERAFALMAHDEQLMSSARRVGNILEMASVYAKKNEGKMLFEHVEKAVRAAA